jgi:hypothetical protein
MKLHPPRSENDSIVDGSKIVHALNPKTHHTKSQRPAPLEGQLRVPSWLTTRPR